MSYKLTYNSRSLYKKKTQIIYETSEYLSYLMSVYIHLAGSKYSMPPPHVNLSLYKGKES